MGALTTNQKGAIAEEVISVCAEHACRVAPNVDEMTSVR